MSVVVNVCKRSNNQLYFWTEVNGKTSSLTGDRPTSTPVQGKGMHFVVEVPADWPVKLSSPLSTVAHTTTASHYRFVIIVQLTGHIHMLPYKMLVVVVLQQDQHSTRLLKTSPRD